MTLEQVWEGPYSVASPVIDAEGSLYCTCTTTGIVLKLTKAENGGTLVPVVETNGTPTGLALDPTTNELFIADQARHSVVKVEAQGNELQLTQFVDQFEGRLLRGPNRLCFDRDGEMIFTDSGAMGDTGLANPRGAVFRTVQGRQQLVHLISPALAHPSGLASAADGSIYVCETAANRLIRFAQRPAGVFHASVFAYFAGGFGPIDVAIHPRTGDIYVAKYDFHSLATTGSIVVLHQSGDEKGTITVPGPEISGICFDSSGSFSYVTEQSQKRIYRMKAV